MEKETMKQRSAVSSQQSATKLATCHLLLVTCLLFTCHLSLVTVVHAAAVDEIVNNIQKKLSEIHDMKGAFSQISYLKDLEKTERYSGTFYIKKPSGIMWEYKTPRDEKVIINKTDTWIYKKSEKKAIKTRFSKEAYSQVPIALLNGLENLGADFDITLMEQDTLNLKPRRQMGFIKEIILKTSTKNFPVKILKVLDMYGNNITIELTDIKTNNGLDDSLFTFTVPQGVEVFDMSQ